MANPESYIIETPGTASRVPHWNVMLPLTLDEVHVLGGRRQVTRLSFDSELLGDRMTYRIGYASHFGWSVLRDWPGWYAAVLTSPRDYDECAKYLTECVAPNRWWGGPNLLIEEWR